METITVVGAILMLFGMIGAVTTVIIIDGFGKPFTHATGMWSNIFGFSWLIGTLVFFGGYTVLAYGPF
jgi:hypothetical protein